ncbi:Ubiquitin carboxyl-terminal hydrolase 26 [Trifolium repens]|nr:Ubiquitin carboxyl-terminal hydrolase 26 [Trifolium repens]
MRRPTTQRKKKKRRDGEEERRRGACEYDVTRTPKILRAIDTTGVPTKDQIYHLYMITKLICSGCHVNTKDNPNCFCALVPPPSSDTELRASIWQNTFEFDPNTELRASGSPAGLNNLGGTCYINSTLQCYFSRRVIFCRTRDPQAHEDIHEFMKGLLKELSDCLSHSKNSKTRSLVEYLFRGSKSFVHTCSQCGTTTSSEMELFYELQLNVMGLESLDESLDEYLRDEENNDVIQFFCDVCKRSVVATSRKTVLRELPRVLIFELKRYVFCQKTIKAKKVSSTFSFPAELSMRRILSEPSQPELLYELSSFVQHYGNAVDHGHYVAHIKDENTGQWWRFNDKIVTKDSQSSLTKTFSSEDHYFEEIQTSNATYQKKYNQRKEKESSLINERTEEVRSVLSEASVQSLSQPFFWISCDWLRQWDKNVTQSAIDNTAITCSHGKVPVSKVTSMKRLSSKAWETLLEKYGGEPKLSHEDCCLDCLKEGAQNVMSADTYRDRRESFKQLAWDILDGKNEDGKYYVSRSWLLQWSIGEIPDAPSEANSNPTSDIT